MNDPLNVTNLFDHPGDGPETFSELVRTGKVKLEHILSNGKSSEPGCWYDQADDEWVSLIQGTATLEFEDGETLDLVAGDALIIPAHRRHRVASTSQDAVWLALHYPPPMVES